MTTQNIKSRYQNTLRAIEEYSDLYHRNGKDIHLLAVSKKQPIKHIEQLYHCNHKDFGENQLQEALEKIEALKHLSDICWHFIGNIQSNKTNDIAQHFSWVHSLDRLKIAQRLSAQRPKELPPLNAFIQVNIDGETQKSGIAPEQALELADAMIKLPKLRLCGLMVLPKSCSEFGQQRSAFAKVRQLQEQLAKQGIPLHQLSMGMSNDFEAAIAEGSHWVRIGTQLFGKRVT